MDYSQAIAAEIRMEQARRLWSRRELARRVEKPTTTVNRWLRGETPMTLDEVAAFAKALDMPAVDLVRRAMAVGSPGMPNSPDPDSTTKVISTRRWSLAQFAPVAA